MEAETTAAATTNSPGLEATTAVEAFQLTAAAFADRVALRTREDAESHTWAEYAERVRRIAAGLAALGVGRGDTVGLMLTNRPEFHFADTAAIHLGATPFSLYNSSAPEQAAYVVGDAGSAIVFTEEAFLDTVLEVRDTVPTLTHVVVVDGQARDGAITLEELERGGAGDFDFEAAWRAVEPDDLLTLIYTSGTTGPPKGVELSHRSVVAAGHGLHEMVRPRPGGRVVSWLPMAHIAERNCSHYLPMTHGMTTTCCPDPRQLIAYVAEVRPTFFFAVPRIWEKLKAALEIGFEQEQDPVRRKAVEVAIDVGRRRMEAGQGTGGVPDELELEFSRSDAAVLSGIRRRLGFDQLEFVAVAAAPCPREVIEFFHALGVPLTELWGMSETSGVGTLNPRERIRIGTVGPPKPGVELKLADDGEILVRGEVVMSGYRNQPEKTAETIDPDGWLQTGDIGELDDDGYLKIVDRKKELIISASGKNMSPANIEAEIKTASPLIGQAIAIGDDRPYNVALLVLDPDAAPVFAQQHGIESTSLEEIAAEKTVLDEVSAALERANAKLARVEQIKRFELLPAEWLPGGDELTPTMKLKRKPIAHKYAEQIEALYAGA
jgi:long-subunit acyl-CoA synthetase (AMP-forming)